MPWNHSKLYWQSIWSVAAHLRTSSTVASVKTRLALSVIDGIRSKPITYQTNGKYFVYAMLCVYVNHHKLHQPLIIFSWILHIHCDYIRWSHRIYLTAAHSFFCGRRTLGGVWDMTSNWLYDWLIQIYTRPPMRSIMGSRNKEEFPFRRFPKTTDNHLRQAHACLTLELCKRILKKSTQITQAHMNPPSPESSCHFIIFCSLLPVSPSCTSPAPPGCTSCRWRTTAGWCSWFQFPPKTSRWSSGKHLPLKKISGCELVGIDIL